MSEEKNNRSRKQEQNENQNGYYEEPPRRNTRQRRQSSYEDTRQPKNEPKVKKKKEKRPKKPANPSSVGNQLAIILLAVFTVFLIICYAFPDSVGTVGRFIRDLFFGLFGNGAFAVPLLLIELAVFWRMDVKTGAIKYKYIVSLLFVLFLSVVLHTFYRLTLGEDITAGLLGWGHLSTLFERGTDFQGGGFLGGFLALCLLRAVGYPGTFIFSFLFLAGFGMALVGLTPAECYARFRFYCQRNKKGRAAWRSENARRKEEAAYQKRTAEAARTTAVTVRKSGIDESIFDDDAGLTENGRAKQTVYPVQVNEISLDDIFDKKDDPAVLRHYAGNGQDDGEDEPQKTAQTDVAVEKRRPAPKRTDVQKPAEPSRPQPAPKPAPYQFPPITLLQAEPQRTNTDSTAELRDNADRIVQTLSSFHVNVSISNISRGPTVTRYEVEPSAGTSVKSITNRLEDIALSLASSGVRCDGIIAGKSAIGIEVPNKTVNTVYVRGLIENTQFGEAKSRLTTSLGKDVSGMPIYLDIAKMPHLLIAGATGMGKSVCINSLLVSLLYKARPDEVKLILIDPKKVELNIYNGIPHLLVPVVFDPKKAAGSLHWAVTEMERRFELIEAQNTRNITQYNAAIAGDPKKEFLPQVVIIIDELADLMMSAPDDVEASICRLAQKARAAGMHLIIGTQRPSVDVITGLIKANIPSRIAFTVASQIDSRTIIDMQGAEKLIGRGDMLYAPVGASKPIRVQGAFVSEKEIDEIVEFIKAHSKDCAYSSEVIEEIDRAAELCGQKKGKASAATEGGGDDGDSTDPLLDDAIRLAVESGKISTSFMQRNLSVGYGRAAKLIDIMEHRGIVSGPDGQKPRTVLLTREQYLEMKMNGVNENESSSDEEDDDDDAPF